MKTAERMAGQPLEIGDSLTRYLTEISQHDLLTADEEVELAQAIETGREAEEQLAANALQALDMNFGTAIELLGSATEVDGERYRDAFLPLARAAWYSGKLELARGAAKEALRRYPSAAAPGWGDRQGPCADPRCGGVSC